MDAERSMVREGVAGVIAYAVMATVLNLILRLASPDYAVVEKAITFTLRMMGRAARDSDAPMIGAPWE